MCWTNLTRSSHFAFTKVTNRFAAVSDMRVRLLASPDKKTARHATAPRFPGLSTLESRNVRSAGIAPTGWFRNRAALQSIVTV
jgi:hypothetical protein